MQSCRYGILGNHDYGELWNVTGLMPRPPNCGNASDCSYSPLHQVLLACSAHNFVSLGDLGPLL